MHCSQVCEATACGPHVYIAGTASCDECKAAGGERPVPIPIGWWKVGTQRLCVVGRRMSM